MNNLKKDLFQRRREEQNLINNINSIPSCGSFLNVAINKGVDSKKYKIYKKRYLEMLDDTEKSIKTLRSMVKNQETKAIKVEKFKKISNEQEEKKKEKEEEI